MPRNFARNLNRKDNDGSSGRYREAEDERAVLENDGSSTNETDSRRAADSARREDDVEPMGDQMETD
jgi:hypothetical protein